MRSKLIDYFVGHAADPRYPEALDDFRDFDERSESGVPLIIALAFGVSALAVALILG